MKNRAQYFSQQLCEFLKTQPQSISDITNLPLLFYNLITSYNVPKLIYESNGVYNTSNSDEHGLYSAITLKKLDEANRGSYGVLYYCDVNNKYYYLKTNKEPNVSLKNEAFLQLGAHIILSYYNMPWAIPSVHHIVDVPDYNVCFTMDIVTDMKTFGRHMMEHMKWNTKCIENDVLVMELLCQLALYIMILEKDLGMNHRDLKLNNVLMVKQEPLVKHTIEIDGATYVLNSSARAVLIDFGFACIGDLETRGSLLSASEYGIVVDMCPKAGRDMFLILANMWNVPAVRGALTPTAAGLFKKWLVDNTGKNWSSWLAVNRDPELKSVYNAINHANFLGVNSTPAKILEDIRGSYEGVFSLKNITINI